MNLTPLYIFDLDGTLALIDHRRRLVQLVDGSKVTVPDNTPGIYRGPNSKLEGDIWVEFDGGGTWSYDASDVKFKPDWDKFYAECVNDQPNIPVIGTLIRLFMFADIYIFSGRSDVVQKETIEWLNKYGVDFNYMLMRKDGDYTPDHELKLSWYQSLSTYDQQRLVAVFDDRDKVVDMWREQGITCFQVAPGDF
jgi:hypothetical protein